MKIFLEPITAHQRCRSNTAKFIIKMTYIFGQFYLHAFVKTRKTSLIHFKWGQRGNSHIVYFFSYHLNIVVGFNTK